MLKRSPSVLLFMAVFAASLLVCISPVGAQDTTNLTSASLDDGVIQTDLIGGLVPVNSCYKAPGTDICQPMFQAQIFLICNGMPAANLSNCRKVKTMTLGAAYSNPGLIGGGSGWSFWP